MLKWYREIDENDNTLWKATSRVYIEKFEYVIKQIIVGDKIVWGERHSPELSQEQNHFSSLHRAQLHCEQIEDEHLKIRQSKRVPIKDIWDKQGTVFYFGSSSEEKNPTTYMICCDRHNNYYTVDLLQGTIAEYPDIPDFRKLKVVISKIKTISVEKEY